jgi:hypothetical protein
LAGKSKSDSNENLSLGNIMIPLKQKLNYLLINFHKKLNEDLELSHEAEKLLKLILKFLFDFNISDSEFNNLTPIHKNQFKKFIADRFFKHEAGTSKDYLMVYHNVSVNSDNLSTFSIASRNISRNSSQREIERVNSDGKHCQKFEKKIVKLSNFSHNIGEISIVPPLKNAFQESINQNHFSNNNNKSSFVRVNSFCPKNHFFRTLKTKKISKIVKNQRSKGSIKVRVRQSKPGILKYISSDFLSDSLIKSKIPKNPDEINFKMSRFTLKDVYDPDMRFSLLQDYLRKRERLNLVCKRRKKMHSKTKRNDEKTKKIFKRAMKRLFTKFKMNSHLIKYFF